LHGSIDRQNDVANRIPFHKKSKKRSVSSFHLSASLSFHLSVLSRDDYEPLTADS
jgi:hypothetical protein